MHNQPEYNLEVGVATGPARISYPLVEDDDPDAILIEQDYYIFAANYTPAILNEELYIPSDLKHPFVPAGPMPDAYRAHDVKKGYFGKVLLFTKRWASLPEAKEGIYRGSGTFPFPSVQNVVYTPPATAEAADTPENLYKLVEARSANGNPAPMYMDTEYFFSANPPAFPKAFRPTYNGSAVDFLTNGGSGSFSGAKALNGDTFTAAYNVGESTPTATAYAALVASGEMLVVDVQIERYYGDIFVMRTYKMKAQ